MNVRLPFAKLAPEGVAALFGVSKFVQSASIEPKLLHLIDMRASQINGCGYCIDMHSQDARAGGETEQRLYALNAWRETPFFTDRERAALAWTEAVTLISHTHAPDELFEETRKHFSEKEMVDLTFAIVAINSWNRVAISFRAVPGNYHPAAPRV